MEVVGREVYSGMTFLTYYGIMLIASLFVNYVIQGPERLINEEEGSTN